MKPNKTKYNYPMDSRGQRYISVTHVLHAYREAVEKLCPEYDSSVFKAVHPDPLKLTFINVRNRLELGKGSWRTWKDNVFVNIPNSRRRCLKVILKASTDKRVRVEAEIE